MSLPFFVLISLLWAYSALGDVDPQANDAVVASDGAGNLYGGHRRELRHHNTRIENKRTASWEKLEGKVDRVTENSYQDKRAEVARVVTPLASLQDKKKTLSHADSSSIDSRAENVELTRKKSGKKGSSKSPTPGPIKSTPGPTLEPADYSTSNPTNSKSSSTTSRKSSSGKKRQKGGKKNGKKRGSNYQSSDGSNETEETRTNDDEGYGGTAPSIDNVLTSPPDTDLPSPSPSPSPTAAPSIETNIRDAVVDALSLSPTLAPTTSPSSSNDGFYIETDLYNISTRDSLVFRQAAVKWQSVIVGDVPDVLFSNGMKEESLCKHIPDVVDDIHVCGWYTEGEDSDGVGGVLGWAGPEFVRMDSLLPITGVMQFDKADVEALGDDFMRVVRHEMGHVLGLGTIWEAKGLTLSADQGCPYSQDSAASREWQALSGCLGSPPVEFDFNDGTKCGHWDEECFQSELMTGFDTGGMELSRVTIGSLEDLGYSVDYSQADNYTSAHVAESCLCDPSMVAHGNLRTEKKPNKKRKLSDKGQKQAVEFGKKHLKDMEKRSKTHDKVIQDSPVLFVADQVVSVLFVENDIVHAVEVSSENKKKKNKV